ncbi:AlpA family phage regulatory protein [Paraburkholderia sp. 1N]|uniref:AlpA family phage regulatory protein n=1 Tax=Paraburkholderia solitsugae TaxID=2675748 RepID=A0ABX2BKI0_9BURK|nr:AlpA family phage regulatory protein [Paraburkholderia solitsugae]NPT41256.1 AlpA family phage regulatory protein [Paraburkholderia solitsugae]
MVFTFIKPQIEANAAAKKTGKKAKPTHRATTAVEPVLPVKPVKQSPIIDLSQPGRLRVNDVIKLLAISRPTLYARVRDGKFPQPDGHDAKIPFWRTETLREFLKK